MGGSAAPALGKSSTFDSRHARGRSIPSVMDSSEMKVTSATPARSLGTLALAVVAPFGAIALLATPLIFDALTHAFGG
jgi:hypothetical protein